MLFMLYAILRLHAVLGLVSLYRMWVCLLTRLFLVSGGEGVPTI